MATQPLPAPYAAASSPPSIPPAVKLALSPAEAAAALSVDRSTLYQLLNSGALASFHIGRARRISVRALEAFIAAQERTGEGVCDASA